MPKKIKLLPPHLDYINVKIKSRCVVCGHKYDKDTRQTTDVCDWCRYQFFSTAEMLKEEIKRSKA